MSEYTDIVSDGGLDPRNAFDVPAAPTTLEPVASVAVKVSIIGSVHKTPAENYVLLSDVAAIIAAKDAEITELRQMQINSVEKLNAASEKTGIYAGCDTPDDLADSVIDLRAEVERLTEKNQLLNSAFCESVDDVERLTRERDEKILLNNQLADYLGEAEEQLAAAQKSDAYPQAHRLALELECLLLSCTDTAATAKWWDSAHEALEQWREFCREDSTHNAKFNGGAAFAPSAAMPGCAADSQEEK